jgi:hypothetical protein
MADQFSDLETALRQARTAQIFLDQANALLASPADQVKFSCDNPPYRGVFVLDLPRSVWGPILQAQVDAASGTVATAQDAVTAMKGTVDAEVAVKA